MSMRLRQIIDAESIAPKGRKAQLALIPEKDYSDGKTVQAFKDETDIQRMLSRAQQAGTLSHLQKYEAQYGDLADFDFLETQVKLVQAREIFDELPSEIRTEFHQSPAQFFAYVNDPANAGRLEELLPALAAPGRQNIDVSGKTQPPVVAPAATSEPTANVPSNPPVDPPATVNEPPAGSD